MGGQVRGKMGRRDTEDGDGRRSRNGVGPREEREGTARAKGTTASCKANHVARAEGATG